MKSAAIAAIVCCTCLAAAGQSRDKGNAAFVKAAKVRIERQLNDPGSVQYRGLFLSARAESGEPVLCGELNARNLHGGYAGFRPFISSLGSMVYMGDQIDAIWPEFCGRSLADVK